MNEERRKEEEEKPEEIRVGKGMKGGEKQGRKEAWRRGKVKDEKFEAKKMRIRLRKAEAADIPGMAELFRNTVLFVNAANYTPEETKDWASCGEDKAHWEDLLKELHFVVAETVESRSNKAVPEARSGREMQLGFVSIREDGYLHSMFVHKSYQRCGIATALLQTVEQYAEENGAERIWSEVSLTARPFFEEKGYVVTKEQRRRANLLELRNFIMEKRLRGNAEG